MSAATVLDHDEPRSPLLLCRADCLLLIEILEEYLSELRVKYELLPRVKALVTMVSECGDGQPWDT